MTREKMIDLLTDDAVSSWWEWKSYDIKDLFLNGLRGYADYSDEELHQALIDHNLIEEEMEE